MAWYNNFLSDRMANDANRTFPQGTGGGFAPINRNPLLAGVMGLSSLGAPGGLPAGTTLPTGSTAGRTGGSGLPGALATGGIGRLMGDPSSVPGLTSGTGPQAPTPGFQPRLPTPGGAGMGPTGAPGTLPTSPNAPPQGLMSILQGLMAGGGGMSPGGPAPPSLGGGMLGGGSPLGNSAISGIPGLAGASGGLGGGGLAGLIAALRGANQGGPGQQSQGTPT